MPHPDSNLLPIRLLRLLPGASSDPLRIEFEIFDLENKPPYFEALSYAWGEPNPDHDAEVVVLSSSGDSLGSLIVWENLQSALQHLRLPDEPRMLWIDALCIDQHDIQQKNHDVARMHEIYRRADLVLVWLGVDGQHNRSSAALQYIEKMASLVTVNWDLHTMVVNEPHGSGSFLVDPTWTLPSRVMEDVLYLFKADWFERLWVRQEIWLARTAEVKCGSMAIDWEVFRNGCFAIHDRGSRSSQPGWSSALLQSIFALITGAPSDTRGWRLYSLLNNTAFCRCTDDKDRIYALLGLLNSSPSNSLTLQPDYSLSPSEVYRDVILANLGKPEMFDFLLRADLATKIPDKPSWIPNLARPGNHGLDTATHACPFMPPPISRPHGQSALQLSAKRVSIISTVIPLYYQRAQKPWLQQLRESGSNDIFNRLRMVHRVLANVTFPAEFYTRYAPASEKATCSQPPASQPVTRTSGALLDHPERLSLVEAVLRTLVRDQFRNLKAGDEHEFPPQSFQAHTKPPCDALLAVFAVPEDVLAARIRDESLRTVLISMEKEQETATSTRHSTPRDNIWEYFEKYSIQDTPYSVLFITEDGYMGLGTIATAVGDEVYVVIGARAPVVLRPGPGEGEHQIVGACYLHGAMNGEALMGPLPPHVDRIIVSRELDGTRFHDHHTGKIWPCDPRIFERFPHAAWDKIHKLVSGIGIEDFEREGIELETLHLV